MYLQSPKVKIQTNKVYLNGRALANMHRALGSTLSKIKKILCVCLCICVHINIHTCVGR